MAANKTGGWTYFLKYVTHYKAVPFFRKTNLHLSPLYTRPSINYFRHISNYGRGMTWAWHGKCESDTATLCK